jgi:hypothetical protein
MNSDIKAEICQEIVFADQVEMLEQSLAKRGLICDISLIAKLASPCVSDKIDGVYLLDSGLNIGYVDCFVRLWFSLRDYESKRDLIYELLWIDMEQKNNIAYTLFDITLAEQTDAKEEFYGLILSYAKFAFESLEKPVDLILYNKVMSFFVRTLYHHDCEAFYFCAINIFKLKYHPSFLMSTSASLLLTVKDQNHVEELLYIICASTIPIQPLDYINIKYLNHENPRLRYTVCHRLHKSTTLSEYDINAVALKLFNEEHIVRSSAAEFLYQIDTCTRFSSTAIYISLCMTDYEDNVTNMLALAAVKNCKNTDVYKTVIEKLCKSSNESIRLLAYFLTK